MAGLLTIAAFAVIVVAVAIFKSQWLIYLYAISLPFFGVIAEVGVQITPFQVVAAGMLFSLIMNPKQINIPVSLIPFMIYAIGITILMSFFLPDEIYNYPALRGKFRWISQIVLFILMISPIIFIISKKYSKAVIYRIFQIFLFVVSLICISGIIQLIVFKISGKDIFPLNLFLFSGEEDKLRSGLTKIAADEQILRMSGLGAGEPKHFGYTCAIALQLLIWLWIFKDRMNGQKAIFNLIMAALFITGILFSLSTQSYLIAGLNICLITLILIFTKGMRSKKTWALISMLALASILIYQNNYLKKLVELRLYERLAETGAIEDFNQTISNFLIDQPQFIPFGTGMGNVHFWAADYIPRQFAYFMTNSVFVAKAGFLRILSELGITGLILFIGVFGYAGWKLYKINRKRFLPVQSIVLGFLFLSLMDYFVTSDASPYYIFALMLTLLCIHNDKYMVRAEQG